MKKSVRNLVKTKKGLEITQREVLYNEFLKFSVATSEKHNFISISKSMFFVFPQHMSCRALL